MRVISRVGKGIAAIVTVLVTVVAVLAIPLFTANQERESISRTGPVATDISRGGSPKTPFLLSDLNNLLRNPIVGATAMSVAAIAAPPWVRSVIAKASSVKPEKSLNTAARGRLSDAPFENDVVSDQTVSTGLAINQDDSVATFFAAVLRASGMIGGAARYQNPQTSLDLPKAEIHERYCTQLPSNVETVASARLMKGIIPKGLVLDRATAKLCGTPIETGIFRFVIEIADSSGVLALFSYRLVVAEEPSTDPEQPLEIISTQLAVGQVGAEYSFQLRVQGGESPFRWDVQGLPPGLEFDSDSGLIAGSPESAGEHSLTIDVYDALGGQDARSLSLVVRVTPVFITTQALGQAVVGELFQARVQAQGGTPPYRWAVISASLPEGIELNPANGALEGVPQSVSESLFRLQVTDALGKTDAAEFPLIVQTSSLTILSEAIVDGFQFTSYLFSFDAQGGVPPYQWSTVSGILPEGLSLDARGIITGTPQSHGEFPVTVVVSDSQSGSAKKKFRLRVQETAQPPGQGTVDEENEPDTTETTGGSPNTTDEPDIPALAGVEFFIAVPSDRKAGLAWKNPSAISFVETVIVRNTEHAPQDQTDGVVVYRGQASDVVDGGAANDQLTYYAAFVSHGAEGWAESSESSLVSVTPRRPDIQGVPDIFIDSVEEFHPLDPKCFGCTKLPGVVLGTPQGLGDQNQGSLDVVSLGARVNSDGLQTPPYGGSITVEFKDNIVVDGPGVDFTIFENAFRIPASDDIFVEPATVEVSVDGEKFYRFPFDYEPRFRDGELNFFNPFSYVKGFAGVHSVYSNRNSPSPLNTVLSGGDQFDLSSLPAPRPSWIRFVRITSTGDGWLTDPDGHVVRHSNVAPYSAASGLGNSGFDLDAVAAINF